MRPMTAAEIRGSFINCSRRDAERLSLPASLDEISWTELDFLGWRDPVADKCAGLVVARGPSIVGLLMRASSTPGSVRQMAAMCGLCATVHGRSGIALFTARRAGPHGRRGDTVGLYACADLACSEYARGIKAPALPQLGETIGIDERVRRVQGNMERFINRLVERV